MASERPMRPLSLGARGPQESRRALGRHWAPAPRGPLCGQLCPGRAPRCPQGRPLSPESLAETAQGRRRAHAAPSEGHGPPGPTGSAGSSVTRQPVPTGHVAASCPRGLRELRP